MVYKASEIIRYLEKSLDSKILNYSMAPLTAQGDNFGSTMIAMTVKLRLNKSSRIISNTTNAVVTLNLAVKFPVTNDILMTIFQPSVSCVKENSFYTEIIPALCQFQHEFNILDNTLFDMFIQCYGARLSLENTNKFADENAFLILENVKLKGYTIGDRTKGFNKHDTDVVLENMAKFHAYPIALRLLRPNVFEDKIRPYLTPFNIYENIDENGIVFKSACASVSRIKDIDKNLQLKIVLHLKSCSDFRNKKTIPIDSPYTGICHGDLWVNNIMFKSDSLGQVDKVKFCDYQLVSYGSFVHDLIFFLFTSVNSLDRKLYIEHFFEHYHSHFYNTLRLFDCPLGDYTYEKFRAEIEDKAKYELEHILNMLRVIFAEKQAKPGQLSADFFFRDDFVGAKFYESLCSVFSEFEQLNFI